MELLNLLEKVTQYKEDKIEDLYIKYQYNKRNLIQNSIDYSPEPYIITCWSGDRKKNEEKVHDKTASFDLKKSFDSRLRK
jgi:hypothetical protein